jgi:integrase
LVGLAKYLRLDIDWEYDIPPIKFGRKAPIVYSENDEQLVVSYIEHRAKDGVYLGDMFRFLIHTGLRTSEVVGLLPGNFVDGAAPHIVIDKETNTSHSKDSRIVPLDAEALSIIRHHGLPFRFGVSNLRRLIREAREKYSMPKYTPHAARKTWSTRAQKRGVPLTAICAAGGWGDPSTIMHYTERSSQSLHEAFS